MRYTLAEIAKEIGATVIGDETITVSSLATLATAKNNQIAFLANSKYRQQLESTQASAVILSESDQAFCSTNALVMKNPYLGYALVAKLLDSTPKTAEGIHSSAIIDNTAIIEQNVSLGANVVVESGAIIKNGARIGAGCFIGKNAEIGEDTQLWANISIYHHVKIGKNCLIQANTVIGADGFGYANHQGTWHKIPQLGSVVIGDNVEIGASTTIDRGALDNTIIENGVIIDNQVQIAHNAIIGENTAIAGCTVIAGSAKIGKNCTIAGMSAVNGHISIADGTVITGMSMVIKGIEQPGVYSSGMPSLPNKDWHKMNARMRKLDEMAKKITALEKKINTSTET